MSRKLLAELVRWNGVITLVEISRPDDVNKYSAQHCVDMLREVEVRLSRGGGYRELASLVKKKLLDKPSIPPPLSLPAAVYIQPNQFKILIKS